jgi:hypothetical protein
MLTLASTVAGAEAGDASHGVTTLVGFAVGGETMEAATSSALVEM